MAKTKPPPKPSDDNTKQRNDILNLESDVAAFASSLGLSSSHPSSGFNDVDFRETGPPRNPKKQKPKPQLSRPTQNPPKSELGRKPNSKPIPKPSPLTLNDENNGGNKMNFHKYKNFPKLPLVKASSLGVWYEDSMELEKKVLGEGKGGKVELKNMGVVEKKRQLGERLLWQYREDYEQSRGQSSDVKMLVATQRSGTAVDRVSAFSVIVGDNPIANLRSLDALLGMVTSKVGKRHALTGFEALKELFITSLLPDRKLKLLLQRPLNNLPESKDGYSLLLFWYWEECLKQRYERFVSALEDASRDMLPILKDKALKTMYALLKSKSEQERKLLSALVNKLGDPQNKGASNADFHLSNLLSDHPNMKVVVIDEIDNFLFRPHLVLRAKYHAVNFLSQIHLSHKGDGPKVAKRLIDVYFALFKVLITEASDTENKKKKKGRQKKKSTSRPSKPGKEESLSESHIGLDSRILSALLTGVNRAFPFVTSAEADDIIEVQTPMLLKLVHSENFNVGIQALMLLDKISSKNQIVSDRFYRALYSKLLFPAAMNSSKAEMFIGLLLRAMKNDVNLSRVAAFSKRLLQVALQQPPQFACGCLFLLSEVLKARPPLWNMVHQNESVDDDLEHFEDIREESDDEPSATPKKEKNDFGTHQGNNKVDSESSSSEDEQNELPSLSSEDDVSDEADELLIEDASNNEFARTQTLPNDKCRQPEASSEGSFLPGGYNPRHREPSYCNADRTSWWELVVLASHAHPSVATMAGTLLSGANIVYNGNPLNDLSLTAFLDKFMEKKPKQSTWHGGSQIEPAKKLDMSNHLIGPEILSLAETDVPPEDLVFHKFYVNKMNTTKTKKKKKKGAEEEAAEELFDVDGGDTVEGDDESDNEEIENMLDTANMSFEADGEYDYDDLDNVANEDDDDLVGNVSDTEMDVLSDVSDGEDFGSNIDVASGDDDNGVDADDDDNDATFGDAVDGSDGDGEVLVSKRKRKRKSSKKISASPFASLEDYEHLLDEDKPTEPKYKKKNEKPKPKKKRKSSS